MEKMLRRVGRVGERPGTAYNWAGRGVKYGVATPKDPAVGVAGDTEGAGKGGATDVRACKVGCHRDDLSVTYQPHPRNQCDNDPPGTNGSGGADNVATGREFERGLASERNCKSASSNIVAASPRIVESVEDVSSRSITDNHGRLTDRGSFCKRGRRWWSLERLTTGKENIPPLTRHLRHLVMASQQGEHGETSTYQRDIRMIELARQLLLARQIRAWG